MNIAIELKPVGNGYYDLLFGREVKAHNITLKQALGIIAEAYDEEDFNNGNKT